MSSMTDWPTSRPGYPMHAERDGWHWLQVSDWPPHAEEWSAARREWKGYHGNKAFDVREGMRALIRYLGPCYAQADLDAAVQAAARVGDIAVNQNAEMRDQLREIDEAVVALSKIVIGEGVLPAGNYPGAAPMLNYLHDTIRARGPTSAPDAALAQARRETWARAAEIAERVAIPEDCHGVEAHGRLMAAHAAADAIRSAAAGEEGK